MPSLDYARTENGKKFGSELGYQTEEEALYIGTFDGTIRENKRLCGVKDIERITDLEAKVTSLEGQISTIMAHLEALESPEE